MSLSQPLASMTAVVLVAGIGCTVDDPGSGSATADVAVRGSRHDGVKPGRVLIKFRVGSEPNLRAGLHHTNGATVEKIIPQLDLHVVTVPPGEAGERVAARYRNQPLVEYAEVETFGRPTLVPNDPWFQYWQIPLQQLGAEAAWELTTGSPAVPIGVLDTGLDVEHAEFASRIASGEIYGYDFAEHDADFDDPNGHGTIVTGVIGAMTNNDHGIAGATWQNPVVVLRTGFGVDRIEAITWAIDNGVRVISMSFGGFTPTSWEADLHQYAFDHGVVLVGAAGNEGTDQPFYPAAYPTVLAVTGVSSGGDPIGYNWGDWIDVSAPGGGVLTTRRPEDDPDGDGIGFAGGTSIAAPFVAAAAGLVLSANSELTPTQVMEIIRTTADDVGEPGFDPLTGWGRVNFHAAVLAALETDPPPPDITPPSVAVAAPADGEVLSGMATILASASDDTGVARVDLYVDGAFVSSDTVAPHQWALDTTALTDGTHMLTALAYDAAGNEGVSAPVSVTVENQAPLPEPYCGDGGCAGAETACTCAADCGAPAASESVGASCRDDLDDDCDGSADCADSDCAGDSQCAACDGDGLCEAGESCLNCPGDCAGRTRGRPSRRYCCGNGLLEPAEGSGAVCDGHP